MTLCLLLIVFLRLSGSFLIAGIFPVPTLPLLL
nr:MAG TPA: hypothetical protein [Inoviridae sp.]